MRKLGEWILVALFAAAVGVGCALINQVAWPTCKPDGHETERQAFNLVIGGAMLMAGCPAPGGHR